MFYVAFQCFLHPGDFEIEINICERSFAYFHYASFEILVSQIIW